MKFEIKPEGHHEGFGMRRYISSIVGGQKKR